MLTNPFSGKELFIFYSYRMINNTDEIQLEELWEQIGETKKQTWNDMAKMINERMRSEPNFIKGEVS